MARLGTSGQRRLGSRAGPAAPAGVRRNGVPIETLEHRLLLAADSGNTITPSGLMGPLPAPGQARPGGVVSMRWQGQQVAARQGEWILRMDAAGEDAGGR